MGAKPVTSLTRFPGTAPAGDTEEATRNPWSVHDAELVGPFVDDQVVFLGPVGVGKSTAVGTISTIAPVSTEVFAATWDDFYVRTKTTTTVGIEFGIWQRSDGTNVALYGTPGQERFEAVRSPARNPKAALVLWFFGHADFLEDQIDEWLSIIDQIGALHRVVIAVNFTDDELTDPTSELKHLLQRHGYPPIPVHTVDPRRFVDVATIIEKALKQRG